MYPQTITSEYYPPYELNPKRCKTKKITEKIKRAKNAQKMDNRAKNAQKREKNGKNGLKTVKNVFFFDVFEPFAEIYQENIYLRG